MNFEALQQYLIFWKSALGATEEQLNDRKLHFTKTGNYLKRDSNIIYVLTNLKNGSRIINATQQNLDLITNFYQKALQQNSGRLPAEFFLPHLNLVYDDVDFFIEKELITPTNSLEVGFHAEVFQPSHSESLKLFLTECTDEELDILDFDMADPDLRIFLIFHRSKVVAVASYCGVWNFPKITDITIVTRKEFRGRGLAKHLLFSLMSDALKSGFQIRYRVRNDRMSSIKLVESLGLARQNYIQGFVRR